MELILFQPEIPENTGNVARLCAATGVRLHLIEPLGFSLDETRLRRAGLDYWPLMDNHVWPDLPTLLATVPTQRLVLTSARHGTPMHQFDFAPDDLLVMGRETAGLPDWVYALSPHRVRIPFHPARRGEDVPVEYRTTTPIKGVRSLNMSTAAGIVLYTALARSGILDTWESSCELMPS